MDDNNTVFNSTLDTCRMTLPSNDNLESQIYKMMSGFSAFGIVGNLLSLFILLKRMRETVSRFEMFSLTGLVALVCSDMMVCVSTLPWSFVFKQHRFSVGEPSYGLIYSVYSSAVINTSMLCSTLLTVSLAVSRYLIILKPIKMRVYVGWRVTVTNAVCVILVAVVLNLPKFFMSEIKKCSLNGDTMYTISTNQYFKDEINAMTYNTCYFLLAIVLPLIVLAVCNIGFVQHLRNPDPQLCNSVYSSSGQQHKYKNSTASSSSIKGSDGHGNALLTRILLAIVVTFIVLMTPAEIVTFMGSIDRSANSKLVAVFNLMQLTNFTINFIFYCFLNSHIRQFFKQWLCVCC